MESKKKVAVAGLASLLLVAMVIGVTISFTKHGEPTTDQQNGGGVSATNKAVKSICSPTDYKETCEESLAKANSTDPKELIKVAFEATVKNIGGVIKNSSLLKEAASDPMTKKAFETCEQLLDNSIDDLRRSFDKVDHFDIAKVDEYVEDLKVWLSASITYQETCIDGFENITGNTGEKMRNLLKKASELSSNGLAMVNDFGSVVSSLQIQGLQRRLLSDEIPSFVGSNARKILAATRASLRPNAVVAQDGSGRFRTINDALATVPKKNVNPFVIYIKTGLYKEHVMIPRKMNNVILIGEGPTRTIISGSKNYASGTQTYHSATVAVNADDFLAKDISFENTAGPEGHQAVALRVSGDRAIFYNVHMNGFQDTLYTHTYRQFYRDCLITGTIDFVFGDAVAVFQRCQFMVRKPMLNQACMVTAQGRKEQRGAGIIVIQNSEIIAAPAFKAAKPALIAYLGRPWKEYSRTIIMDSFIDESIDPEGWAPWAGTYALDTLYYGEFRNRGPGAGLARRVKWKGIKKITRRLARSFTAGSLFQVDSWITESGIPYVAGFMKA